MERHFDQEFSGLKDRILAMGKRVENAIEAAIEGLVNRDQKSLEKVHKFEEEINKNHVEVDEACLKILAKQSPLATNLRFVISVIKVNADLERMGDQAVNIAQNSRLYIAHEPIKPLVDLPKMAAEVRVMVNEALQSFVSRDVDLAKKVLRHDDIVDQFKGKIFDELVEIMSKDGKTVKRALELILIARNFERLGDHATNIAEETIFDVSGKDIRHGPRNSSVAAR